MSLLRLTRHWLGWRPSDEPGLENARGQLARRPATDGPAASTCANVPYTERAPSDRSRRSARDRFAHFGFVVLHLAARENASRHRFTLLGWMWPLAWQVAQLAVLVFMFSKVIPLHVHNFTAFVFAGLTVDLVLERRVGRDDFTSLLPAPGLLAACASGCRSGCSRSRSAARRGYGAPGALHHHRVEWGPVVDDPVSTCGSGDPVPLDVRDRLDRGGRICVPPRPPKPRCAGPTAALLLDAGLLRSSASAGSLRVAPARKPDDYAHRSVPGGDDRRCPAAGVAPWACRASSVVVAFVGYWCSSGFSPGSWTSCDRGRPMGSGAGAEAVELEDVWKAYPRWEAGTRTIRGIASRRSALFARGGQQRWALRAVSFTVRQAAAWESSARTEPASRHASALPPASPGQHKAGFSGRRTRCQSSAWGTSSILPSPVARRFTAAILAGLRPRLARQLVRQALEFAELENRRRSGADVQRRNEAAPCLWCHRSASPCRSARRRGPRGGRSPIPGECRAHPRAAPRGDDACSGFTRPRSDQRGMRPSPLASGRRCPVVRRIPRRCGCISWCDEVEDSGDDTPASADNRRRPGAPPESIRQSGSNDYRRYAEARGRRAHRQHPFRRSPAVWVELQSHIGPVGDALVAVALRRASDGVVCSDSNTETDGVSVGVGWAPTAVQIVYERVDLLPGDYDVEVGVYAASWEYAYDVHFNAYSLRVIGSREAGGVFRAPHRWVVTPEARTFLSVDE